jgi:quercetin dioxygenase-like cupin family protein
MQRLNINNYTRGWVAGNFEPSIFNSENFECAIKTFKAGEIEQKHYHHSSRELTIVISGKIEMNGEEFSGGEMVLLEVNEISEFKSITDSVCVALRDKSIKGGDKVLCEKS